MHSSSKSPTWQHLACVATRSACVQPLAHMFSPEHGILTEQDDVTAELHMQPFYTCRHTGFQQLQCYWLLQV